MQTFVLVVVFSLIGAIQTLPTSIPNLPYNGEIQTKSIDELMHDQTDAIRKIISEEQKLMNSYIAQEKSEKAESEEQETEKPPSTEISPEKIKTLCDKLKINNSRNVDNDPKVADNTPDFSSYQTKAAYPSYPYFNRFNNTLSYKNNNAFYVTTDTFHNIPTTTKPVTAKPNNIKYIKLEPIILQKTFLTDGKVMYYWHKSLPGAYAFKHNQNSLDSNNNPVNQPYVPKPEPTVETTLPTTTTTTLTTPSYGFFRFLSALNPFDYSSYSSTEQPTTTIKTSEVPTNYRFIVPVPYEDSSEVGKKPSDDQLTYYMANSAQPNGANLPYPFAPVFHIVKAVPVPRNK